MPEQARFLLEGQTQKNTYIAAMVKNQANLCFKKRWENVSRDPRIIVKGKQGLSTLSHLGAWWYGGGFCPHVTVTSLMQTLAAGSKRFQEEDKAWRFGPHRRGMHVALLSPVTSQLGTSGKECTNRCPVRKNTQLPAPGGTILYPPLL